MKRPITAADMEAAATTPVERDILRPWPEFSDNIRVKRGRDSYEYFALSLRPDDAPWRPFRVAFWRYCVPGRCDIYSFEWHNTSRPTKLAFFSDGWYIPLDKALKLAQRDLDRPEVVELCVNAFRASRIVSYYQHDWTQLINVVAPRSKTARAVDKVIDEVVTARRAEIEANKAAS